MVGERLALGAARSAPRSRRAAARSPRSASRPAPRARRGRRGGGVALGRPDHARRRAPRRGRSRPGPARSRVTRVLLVDRAAAPLDRLRPGRAPAGPGGWRRSPGCTSPPSVPVPSSMRAASAASSSRTSSSPRPHARACCDLGTGPRAAGRRCGPATMVPPLWAVGVDALGGRHRERPRRRSSRIARVQREGGARGDEPGSAASRRERRGEQRGAPAAVAAGRAEARGLGLEHGDPQGRVGARQVVGGPEAGEPGADDRHVDVGVAGEGGRGDQASPAVSCHREQARRR